MNYRVVFDIGEVGYQSWWFPAVGLLFIVVGMLARRYRIFPISGTGRIPRLMDKWFWRVWIGFAVVFTAVTFAGTYAEYRSVLSALRNGNVGVVEGQVERFSPSPYQAYESFRVSGHRFSYSDDIIEAGFHNTALRGGPMRDGLHVRVTYVNNGTRWDDEIVRLEIAD